MAKKRCKSCGAPLKDGDKPCARCGKVVSQTPSRRRAKQNVQPAARPAPPKANAVSPFREKSAKPKRALSKKAAAVYRLLTAAVIIAAVYIVIFTVQVFRVRTASYEFESEMKMSCDNFGEAIDNYFDSGSWSADPFTMSCTYKGETKRSEQWEIVFSAGADIRVKSIIIDGERVKASKTETKLMAMFI